jgi:hypothetical protein
VGRSAVVPEGIEIAVDAEIDVFFNIAIYDPNQT